MQAAGRVGAGGLGLQNATSIRWPGAAPGHPGGDVPARRQQEVAEAEGALQQLGVQALSIANQAPQALLSLFR